MKTWYFRVPPQKWTLSYINLHQHLHPRCLEIYEDWSDCSYLLSKGAWTVLSWRHHTRNENEGYCSMPYGTINVTYLACIWYWLWLVYKVFLPIMCESHASGLKTTISCIKDNFSCQTHQLEWIFFSISFIRTIQFNFPENVPKSA